MYKRTGIWAVAFAMLVTGIAFAGFREWQPLNVTVVTSSRMIVPSCMYGATTNVWTTNTSYAYGVTVRNTNNPVAVYWCTSAGTSSNKWTGMPKQYDGDWVDIAGPTWRTVRAAREHLVLMNQGPTDVWLAFGTNAAVVTKGLIVQSGGTLVLPSGDDCPRGQINAITASGSPLLSVQEN